MRFISFSVAALAMIATLFSVACVEEKQEETVVETQEQDTQESQDTQEDSTEEVQEDSTEEVQEDSTGEETTGDTPGDEASVRFLPHVEMLKHTRTAEYIVMEPIYFVVGNHANVL